VKATVLVHKKQPAAPTNEHKIFTFNTTNDIDELVQLYNSSYSTMIGHIID
jgi:hypothetical protein